MKKTKYLILYIVVILLNVVCIFSLAESRSTTNDYKSENILSYEHKSNQCSAIPEPQEKTIKIPSNTVRLYIPELDEVRIMPIDEYLIGVMAGEMYCTAPLEALKAVAVAARTYTIYMAEQNKNNAWDVVADPSSCQAYKTQYIDNDIDVMKKAIKDTKDQVITYNGDIICAMYHASSLNYTENSENVFLEKLPYLSSVKSFETKESAYYSEKTFSEQDINNELKKNNLPTLSESSISLEVVTNENGRCKALTLSDENTGIAISGREAREIFNIMSTEFCIEKEDGKFVFKVYGFGHGVGLSQNGAVIMAENGYNYLEILSHYYSDTDISKTIYKSWIDIKHNVKNIGENKRKR